METAQLTAYLVDDEPLALDRLERLLAAFPAIQVAGRFTDPAQAVEALNRETADLLFLDIQMPGMNGFELLSALREQPFVIFTTAFDHYALKAFEVNSIDYLVKPIEREQLARAIGKLERVRPVAKPAWQSDADLPALLKELASSLHPQQDFPRRIASRVGERISFLDLDAVTHFIAHDKLTYAVASGHRHSVDQSIADLERRLDPARFVRIHRAALVNVDYIFEVNSWFAGKVVVTLKDAPRTQLTVARDRVRSFKSRLGL